MNPSRSATAVAALALLSAPAAAVSPARAIEEDFVRVAQTAKPAVVNIATVQEQEFEVVSPNFFFGDPTDPFGELYGGRGRTFKQRTEGVGSGFIIDPQGHVLTNDHVVRDATEIRVTLSHPGGKDEILSGKVVGRDPNLDLALVQIAARRSFPFIRLADSSAVRVGQWAVAIGSPFALEQTVTVGVISAVRQSLSIEGLAYTNLIQTDAAINRGNSGGPLLNLDGEAVGINTAIFSPSGASAGIGFAIPSNEAKLALEYLLAGRRRRSGWLGVEAAPIDAVLQRRFRLPGRGGALINFVLPGSPAQGAGLRRGDVLWSLDGAEVGSPQDLVARVSRLEPGAAVRLEVFRAGRHLILSARLGERPADAGSAPMAGRAAAPRPPGEFRWEGVAFDGGPDGPRVSRLEPGSPLGGTLFPQDVVRAIDDAQTPDLDSLKKALAGVDLRQGAVFDILRRGQPMYLSVKAN